MNIQRSVLVATPASASFIKLDALQMFQAFNDEIAFKIRRDSNDAIVLYTIREDRHEALVTAVADAFPGRFRTQKVSEERLN
tara:strand:+ start:1835 stop:2080 length:246 start_codon:yes stop_codon:yes gene_type:complete